MIVTLLLEDHTEDITISDCFYKQELVIVRVKVLDLTNNDYLRIVKQRFEQVSGTVYQLVSEEPYTVKREDMI